MYLVRLRIVTYAAVSLFALSTFVPPAPALQPYGFGELERQAVRDTLAAWEKYRGPVSAECVDLGYSLQLAAVSGRHITESCGYNSIGCYHPAEEKRMIMIIDHIYYGDSPYYYQYILAHELIHALDICTGSFLADPHGDSRLWYERGPSSVEAEVGYVLIQRNKESKRRKAAKR